MNGESHDWSRDWRNHLIRWLAALSSEEAQTLEHTREYRGFCRSFEQMELAHRHLRSWNEEMNVDDDHRHFLQAEAADDILLRIFDFLECNSLVQAQMTCQRWRDLAEKSARRRSLAVASERQLPTAMQLLRAREQIDGLGLGSSFHVRVPTLLLRRRVSVTDCGDPEFNGVYYCTGSNGNGFVFTKPRSPEQLLVRTEQWARMILPDENVAPRLESEVAQPGHLLRCIIAKRFSNETILWYLSKEVIAVEDNGEVRAGDVTQLFCFWAKLMMIGDASPDICRYPSQSSILARHDERWETLSTTRTIEPPVVELLD